ncbi:MAG TPA: AraC family transcriptional regulator [Thermoclostridium caenicola]|uniref:AraC family transcriptional regulator n=1 Tax=Thermoclostridium caenicola TaxID=659425 RepID=UPI002C80A808|nr:AraC family transcriptional regulator [Thermoclostridium caenicola]HPO77382.1 AraC family transcriptional regulator [Thermoclostridium caenicola]
MGTGKELFYKEFVRRESDIVHAPYNPELEFFSAIKTGDVHKTCEMCKQSLLDKPGLGILSDDYLQNIKYHFVITAALVARYCIEGGMEPSVAFGLSDFYIQRADKCKSPQEVAVLHPIMCLDYARRMRNLRKKKIVSRHVANCIDYIHDHLHTRITAADLARLVGLNPSYLSRLFKKETGTTIGEYIQSKKIETARNMLAYSDYSPAQISSILAFPSQSYFTEVFRKRTGMTPLKYRARYFRKTEIGKGATSFQ